MADLQNDRKPMLLMVLVALMWSIGGICIKMISWNALVIAGLRGLIAGGILFAYLKKKGMKLRFNKYTFLIAVSLSMCMTCFVFANKLTTAANAIVLQYMCPVWVLIIATVFLKQKIKKTDIVVVIICIGGIAMFFLDQLSPGNLLGNILAILAGVALASLFTCNNICGNEEVQYTGLFAGQMLTFIIGCSGFFMEPFHTTAGEIGFLLILGVFQIGIPYVLFAYVSRRISPLACSLIGMLEPLFNPVWVAVFYGEVPGFYALIGGVIIIFTTSVWCIIQSRQ